MMSQFEESVSTGAAASRRTSDHPTFSLCARLLRERPTAGYTEIKKLWVSEVRDDPDLLDDVLTYAFRNYFSALAGPQDQPTLKHSKDDKKAREEVQKTGAAIIEAIQIRTLKNFLLPNGKVAWDSTCGELGAFGGFLGQVAKLGKSSDLVSSLPLAKLKKIFVPK